MTNEAATASEAAVADGATATSEAAITSEIATTSKAPATNKVPVSLTAQGAFCRTSSLGRIYLAGAGAPEFVRVMTTVAPQRVNIPGRAAPALILNAQGEVLDAVLVTCTGPEEYVLTTHPATIQEVFEWLDAHAALADAAGQPAFEQLSVEDSTSQLESFALYGASATQVLNELTGAHLSKQLDAFALTTATIGQLEVLVYCLPLLAAQVGKGQPQAHLGERQVAACQPGELAEGLVYEVVLPAGAGDAFEELLLSFAELDPEPFEVYCARRLAAHTWFAAAEEAAYVRPLTPCLKALLRPEGDFVGAKALSGVLAPRP